MPSNPTDPRTVVQQLLAQQRAASSSAAHASAEQQTAAHAPAERPEFPFEAELPDHLQLMAEQLSADAWHLSEIYPARSPDSWHAVADRAAAEIAAAEPNAARADLAEPLTPAKKEPPRRKRLLGYALALSAAVLLCGVSLIVYYLAETMPTPLADVPAARDPVIPQPVSPTGAEAPTAQLAQAEPAFDTTTNTAVSPAASGPPASDHAGTDPVLVPAGLFLTLSAPEQEALLDVLDNNGLPQPSVSF